MKRTSHGKFAIERRRPRERELWQLYVQQRMSMREVADHYTVPVSTAHKWLNSLALVDKRRAVDEADRRRNRTRKRPRRSYHPGALRRRAQTMSQKELAEHYGVHRDTIANWCKREGIEPVNGKRPSHPPLAELEAMRAEGMTLAEIGRRYGVSRQRVHQWIQTSSSRT